MIQLQNTSQTIEALAADCLTKPAVHGQLGLVAHQKGLQKQRVGQRQPRRAVTARHESFASSEQPVIAFRDLLQAVELISLPRVSFCWGALPRQGAAVPAPWCAHQRVPPAPHAASLSPHHHGLTVGTGISLWRYLAQSQVDSQTHAARRTVYPFMD